MTEGPPTSGQVPINGIKSVDSYLKMRYKMNKKS
jgi:hypothetical protein